MSYEEFFHLKDAPFRLTPDPDYFFPSGVHKEALDTMVYSIRSGEGFVMITGTPGVGKTLLVRKLLRELGDKVNLALVLSPTISPRELLSVILDDLEITGMEESRDISKEMLLRRFRDYLLDKSSHGVKTIIIIDEAQNLPKDTLEELRMLSNLESDKEKLLQIILVGQLELEERLLYDEMKQLAQRITIRHRLTPLSPEETGAYVRHRLEVAGDGMSVRFMPRVMGRIHSLSSGIPRRINLICERALMAAYVDGEKSVSKKHLVRAIKSIEGHEDKISTVPAWLWPALVGAAVILTALLFAVGYKPEVAPREEISQAKPSAGTDLKSVPKLEQQASASSAPHAAAPVSTNPEASSSHLQPPDSGLQPPDPGPIPKSNIQVNARVLPEPTSASTAASVLQPPVSESPALSGLRPEHLAAEQPYPSLLPANEFYLAVDRDNNLAQLWKGGASGSTAQHEFPLDWRILEGLYLLGNDRDNGAFIFNPILFQWGGYNMLNAAALWDQVGEYVADTENTLVPVIVYSGSKTEKDMPTEDITAIRETINDWAQAWRDRDISSLMGFYAQSFTSYSLDSIEPETYSLAELSEIRARILGTSSYISLNTSVPVILTDPQNPDLAMGVFHQEYSSNTYSDKGVKVLYLRREGEYPERPWKIVAKFFLPED